MTVFKMLGKADLFTLANAALGALAITYISDGKYAIAEGLILLAVIADGLDGIVARRFGGGKAKMGDYLDIMADYLSFCVAPAILFYQVYFNVAPTPFATQPSDVLVGLAAGVFMLLGLLRLARHVAIAGPERGRFQGLPTTGAGFFLTMLVVVGGLGDVLTALFAMGAAWVMVSDFPYPKVRGNAAISSGAMVLQSAVILFVIPPYALGWQVSMFVALAGASLYALSGIALTFFRVRLDKLSDGHEEDGPYPGGPEGRLAAMEDALDAALAQSRAQAAKSQRVEEDLATLSKRMREKVDQIDASAGGAAQSDDSERARDLDRREAELKKREDAVLERRAELDAYYEQLKAASFGDPAGPRGKRAGGPEKPAPKQAAKAARRADETQEVDPDA